MTAWILKIIYFTRSKEWAMMVSIVGAVLSSIPEWANLVDGEINAGAAWPVVLLLLVGAIVRSNVWSADTLRKENDLRTSGEAPEPAHDVITHPILSE